jgi:hypothetical protein
VCLLCPPTYLWFRKEIEVWFQVEQYTITSAIEGDTTNQQDRDDNIGESGSEVDHLK